MAPIKDMIQTLVALKELRIRQEAQDLAQAQFGFDQQRNTQTLAQQAQELKLRQQATNTSSYGQFQQTLQNQKRPEDMLPFAGQFAQMTGQPVAMIEAMMHGTPAAVPTTMGAATQKANESGAIDQTVAQKALSDFNQDKVMTGIFGTAQDYLSKMKPEERQGFGQGVLQRLGTGQSVKDAVLSEQVGKMTPEDKARFAKIATGMGLSANDDASLGLAYGSQQIAQRAQDLSAVMNGLEYDLKVKAFQASGKGDPERNKQVMDILNQRRMAYDQLDKIQSTGTKTSVGLEQYITQINQYNAMLRHLVPEVYGKGAAQETIDIPKGGKLSSGQGAFQQYLNGLLHARQ